MGRVRRFPDAAPALEFLTIAFLLSIPTPATAQAWVAPAGVGAVSLGFQWLDNTGHRLNDGKLDLIFPGKSQDAAIFFTVEYAFTDRLSVELVLPYVFTRYRGPGPTPGEFLPVDSCFCWHSSFQDFRLVTRYNAIGEIGGSFALTPSISIGVPSHDYDSHGEAVVGRNLDEVALAVDAGLRVDAISPKLSVQGHYSYVFVERLLDISTNRSNIAAEAAFQLTRKLGLRGLVAWQRTDGGLRAPDDVTLANFPEHERLLRDDYFRAGVGLSYQLKYLDVYASYVDFVRGTNSHDGRAFTVGVSWPFELGRGP